jgi:hypothetical protein
VLKLDVWATPEQQKAELHRRLKNAAKGRIDIERGWREAERIVFTIQNVDETGSEKVALGDGTGVDDAFVSQPRVSINTTFKNYRFLHSQMSSNPPTVVCRPTSGDLKDKAAADAADRLIRYAIRQYQLQEHFDRCTGHALLYGTGFVKTVWNPDAGEVLEFNEETGEIACEGDIEVTVPLPWDIFIDPDAATWDKARFVFEKLSLPFEQACLMFPDKMELLQKLRQRTESASYPSAPLESEPQPTFLKQHKFDTVEIYEYWEKGLPVNGMQGRFCYCSYEGDPLCDMQPNPFKFAPIKNKLGDGLQKGPVEIAHLPYSQMTDIDNPCAVWGRSTVVYASPIQDIHNALINTMIENARACGVARLLMHEDTEVADDSVTNSPYDIVRWTGTRPPEYQAPAQLPAVMDDLIAQTAKGIDDMFGVNESNFGVQSREQSGFSMQYAQQAGNQIRRRLFNKYTMIVESVFKHFLDLVRKHWDTEQTIYVLGKEKAFESLSLKGSDIEGGFNLVVEYGASLSLDPVSRRQELITMMPLFEKAGVNPKDLLRLVKLSELEGAYDLTQLGADRQQEIFEEIEATGKPVPPRELADHASMLQYAYDYVMTAHYRDLDPEVKQLIDQHVHQREQLAAKGPANPAAAPGAAGGMNQAGTPPGPQTPANASALGAQLPQTAGQTGGQPDLTQAGGAAQPPMAPPGGLLGGPGPGAVPGGPQPKA